MSLLLITAPATEPVTAAEARAHVRQDDTTDDAYLGTLISAARRLAEHRLGRAIITQTWEQVLDAFPAAEIELGMPPVSAIVSVKYIDTAGVQQTLDPANYGLDEVRLPGWVVPAFNFTWPATRDVANAVRVRFTCGWANAAAVPSEIKQWILLTVGTLYANRESVVPSDMIDMPGRFYDALLDPSMTYV